MADNDNQNDEKKPDSGSDEEKQTAAEELDVGIEFELSGSAFELSQPGDLDSPSQRAKSDTVGFEDDNAGFDPGASASKEESLLGFDAPQEVSHLADVDLTLVGTYHRTSRKLHHATDVVWTGPKGASGETPTKRAKEVSPFEGAAPPPPPPRAEPVKDVPLESLVGDEGVGGLDEMDFSELLGGGESGDNLFSEDSNPFLDVGLATERADAEVEDTRQGADEVFKSSDDTNTFFIDAPASNSPDVSNSGSLDVDGGFEVDMDGAELGASAPSGHPAPGSSGRPGAKRTSGSASKSKKGSPKARSSRQAVVALVGLLAVAGGAGVLGEATGYGWFFMNLITGEGTSGSDVVNERPQDPTATAGQSAQANAGAAAVEPPSGPEATTLADTPAAYETAILEARGRMQAVDESDEVRSQAELAKQELYLLLLQYRYRWPGRMHRNEALQAELQSLSSSVTVRNPELQFWANMSVSGETRPTAEQLRQAEVWVSQLDSSTLSPGRDRFYRALLLWERDEKQSALDLLNAAAQANPTDQWVLFARARLLLSVEKLDEADAALQELLQLAPEHRDGQLLAARAAVARQEPDAYATARTLAEKAQTEASTAEDAYGTYEANLMRAVVYGLQNDLGKRVEALEAAAAFDPRDETLLLELAENDLKAGDAERAVERLADCAEGVCSSVRYYMTHIRILYVSHKLPEAETLASQAEATFGDNPDILFWVGKVLEARGKLTLAARKYNLVRERDPRYLEAYLRLAGIYRREKEFDAAITVLDEASQVFEGAGSESDAAMALLQERGELLVRQGRLEQARDVLARVVAAQPNNAPARVRLAKLLTDLGYPETALPHFEKLYEQGRSDPEISISYAEALIRSGRPDRAIDELRRFLEGNPNSLEGLVKLGNAFIQKQRFEEAMAVLEHAVAINRNYAPAYYYAGLAELGRQRQKAEEVERRRRNGEVVPEGSQPDFSKSIVALTTAKDKDPENLVYREALAEALMESDTERNLRSALEQYDTILQEYTKALRLNRPVSRRAEVYYNRGLLASKLGQPRPEILQNFQDALVLDGERADFVARYAEELYRMQSSTRVGDRYQLEAKAYFELILSQHNPNHVRASYYMGRIMLREWDRQRNRRPGDSLHNAALAHFQRVVKHNGADEFPDVLMQIANILRDRGVTRLANRYYTQYLETYRRVHRRDPPNARYVRELMQLKQ